MGTLTHWSFHLLAQLCFFASSTKTAHRITGNTVQRAFLHEIAKHFGMGHTSTGTGADRAIELTKLNVTVPRISPRQLQGWLQHALRNVHNIVSRGEEKARALEHKTMQRLKMKGELTVRPTEHMETQYAPPLDEDLEPALVAAVRRWMAEHVGAVDLAGLHQLELAVAKEFGTDAWVGLGAGSFLAFISRNAALSTLVNDRLCGRPTPPLEEARQLVGQLAQARGDRLHGAEVEEVLRAQFGGHCRVHGRIPVERALDPPPNVYYAAAAAAEADADAPSHAQDGALGPQSKEAALQCLRGSPPLMDLRDVTHWADVFEPSLGPLRAFLRQYAAVAEIHVVFDGDVPFKVDIRHASVGTAFQQAVAALDAPEVAHHLVASVVGSGGLPLAPLALLGNHVHRGLQSCSASPAVRFVLDCLVLLPRCFRRTSLTEVVLLQPLARVVPDARPKLLAACLPHLRPLLYDLAFRLGVPSWTDACQEALAEASPSALRPFSCHAALHTVPDTVCDGPREPPAQAQLAPPCPTPTAAPLHDTETSDPDPPPESPPDVSADAMAAKKKRKKKRSAKGSTDADTTAWAVVETIRREGFGIGVGDLGPAGNAVLAQQHQRVGRALQRLAAELYTTDSHFVLELIQNADDNEYPTDLPEPTLQFSLLDDCLVIRNNEIGFQPANVRAICDVGSSTKDRQQAGYIGQKGIGFKSVFRITDTPMVHSNGFRIRFDSRSAPVRYIVPEWVDPWPQHTLDADWTTHIVLPFKSGDRAAQQADMAAQLGELQPTLLLFLRRLRRVVVTRNQAVICDMALRPNPDAADMVTLTSGAEAQEWLLVHRPLTPTIPRDPTAPVPGSTQITLGFPLSDAPGPLPPQCVFAFLPLRSYGLRFVVQADFVVPSSREDLDQSSAWNQWLRSELPAAFLQALERFKAHPRLRCRFYSYLPLEAEVAGFLRPLATALRAELQHAPCVLTAGEAWVRPAEAVLAPDHVRQLVPDELLRGTLGLHHVHPTAAAGAAAALARLGTAAFSAEHLVDLLEALVHQRRLVALGLEWLAAAFALLHHLLEGVAPEVAARLVTRLASLPAVPSASGSFLAPGQRAVCRSKDGTPTDPIDFAVHGFLGLQLLSPGFGEALDAGDQAALDAVLARLGVASLTVGNVLERHLLPWLASPPPDAAPAAFDAAVGYTLRHWGVVRDRPSILAALRTHLRFRTNRGHIPAEWGVHYGAAFGNPVGDLLSLLPAFPLPVLDAALLTVEPEVRLWREVGQCFGFTDFLPLVRTTRTVESQVGSPWAAEAPWPPCGGRGYVVDDTDCPTLPAVVKALAAGPGPIASLRTFARLLGASWGAHLAPARHATVSARGGGLPWDAPSSFLLSLRATAWVPTQPGKISVPARAFAATEENRTTFGALVDYADAELSEFGEGFLAAIGIQVRPTVPTVLAALSGRSHPDLEAVTPLYSFLSGQLNAHSDAICEAFAKRPLILVPGSGARLPGDVVWSDPAAAFVTTALSAHYPPGLRALFLAIGARPAPSAAQYLTQLERMAAANQLANREAAVRVLLHWSAAVQSGSSGDAAPSREMLEGRAVFPTLSGGWSAIDAPHFLADDMPHVGSHFRGKPGIEFLDLGRVPFAHAEALLTSVQFPMLSAAVASDVHSTGCRPHAAAHRLVAGALPFVQRYLKHHQPAHYTAVVKDGIGERLARRLGVWACDSLHVTHQLYGAHATPPLPAECLLAEDRIYAVRDLVAPQLHQPLASELSRLFYHGRPNAALANFVQLLLSLGRGDPEDWMLQTQSIPALPSDEEIWTLAPVALVAADEAMPDFPPPPPTVPPHLSEFSPPPPTIPPLLLPGFPEGGPPPVGPFAAAGGDTPRPPNGADSTPGESLSGETTPGNRALSAAQTPRTPSSGDRGAGGGKGGKGASAAATTTAAEAALRSVLPAVGAALDGTVTDVEVLDVQCLAGGERGRLFAIVSRMRVQDGDTTARLATLTRAIQPPEGPATLVGVQRLSEDEVAERIRDSSAAGRTPREGTRPAGAALTVMRRAPGKAVIPVGLKVTGAELSDEARQSVGRWGEEAVYRHLCKEHSKEKVQWVNFPHESGKPYDITVELDGELHFVEVKTSKATDKQFFEVSHNEWLTAWREGRRYHIYRVFGAGLEALTVVDVQDPWHCWETGELGVCVVI